MEGSLDLSVGYALKRAQHALRLRVDEALGKVGLTTPQYAVLSVLEDSPGLSGAELARRSFVTPQTMNAIVGKLENAGLVVRSSHPAHGRVLRTDLTEKGRELVSGAHAVVGRVEGQMLSGFRPDERSRLANALHDCASSLEAVEGTSAQ